MNLSRLLAGRKRERELWKWWSADWSDALWSAVRETFLRDS